MLDANSEKVMSRLEGKYPAPVCPKCGVSLEHINAVRTAAHWNEDMGVFDLNIDPACPYCGEDLDDQNFEIV